MSSKMFVDDTPGITLAEMRAKARRLMQQEGRLDLIVIDYLQLMTGSAGSAQKKFENRTQEVSSISRGLKALAKELRVPVVALSQLSRGSEQRTGDKKPLLRDLRESGSIEQDADVVAFIHREEYYDRENEDLKGKAEIIIAKQRNGPTGSCRWRIWRTSRGLRIWTPCMAIPAAHTSFIAQDVPQIISAPDNLLTQCCQ